MARNCYGRGFSDHICGYARRSSSLEPHASVNEKTIEDESDNGDAIICICDPTRKFGSEDRMAAELVRDRKGPAILVVNKTDTADREKIDEVISRYLEFTGDLPVIEISAQTGEGLADLLSELKALMPEGPFLFPADQVTDSIEREIAEEVIRETAIESLHDELPQSISALLESWSDTGKKTRIQASIVVERESQKAIVIGGRSGHREDKKIGPRKVDGYDGYFC